MTQKEDIQNAKIIFKAIDAAITKVVKEDLTDLKHDDNFIFSISLGLVTIGLSYIDAYIDSKKYFDTLDKIIAFYKGSVASLQNKKLPEDNNSSYSSNKTEDFSSIFNMKIPKKPGPNSLN